LYRSPKPFTVKHFKKTINNTHRITNRINCRKLMQFVGFHTLYNTLKNDKVCKYRIFTFTTQLKVFAPDKLLNQYRYKTLRYL